MLMAERSVTQAFALEVYATRHDIPFMTVLKDTPRLYRQYCEYLANCIYHHHLACREEAASCLRAPHTHPLTTASTSNYDHKDEEEGEGGCFYTH